MKMFAVKIICISDGDRFSIEANILMEYVFRFPGVYLREAVKYIDRMSEGHFSAVSLWRCLKRHNFSRKKVNM